MKVGIILSKGHRLLSVAAILDVFETANSFADIQKFDISLLHINGHKAEGYEGCEHKNFTGDEEYDLLLIPAFRQDGVGQALMDNKAWIPLLQKQYERGAAIGSFCTGAFLLASTGLLDGKTATTHINAEPAFMKAFPRVKIHAEAVVTAQDRIYTSGGATNTFHLLMHLLEIYASKELAIRAAKIFSIDLDRSRQDYFGTFVPEENHGDDLVKKAQDEIKKNYSKASTIEEIITGVPSSRRNLVRRFKQVTGITPIEYLQKTRIEAAKQLLEQSRHSIAEVMFESGYNDLKTFRSLFKRNVGMTPKDYREKFSGQVV
ncbi:MAG: GlxA family transcriptional regulator [Flavobacterium sp.]